MNILLFTLVGLVIGVVSNAFEKNTSERSLLGGVFLGSLGGALGGIVASMIVEFQGKSSLSVEMLTIALSGALLLLVMRRMISHI